MNHRAIAASRDGKLYTQRHEPEHRRDIMDEQNEGLGFRIAHYQQPESIYTAIDKLMSCSRPSLNYIVSSMEFKSDALRCLGRNVYRKSYRRTD
jgi:hypothetical protein